MDKLLIELLNNRAGGTGPAVPAVAGPIIFL